MATGTPPSGGLSRALRRTAVRTEPGDESSGGEAGSQPASPLVQKHGGLVKTWR